ETRARDIGLAATTMADFPSVLFAGESSRLCEVRASDGAFPLRGELRVRDAAGIERAAKAPERGTIYAEHEALVALKLSIGDALAIGDRTLTVAAEIARTPDGGQLFALAPRVLMRLEDARDAGLLGAGSRAR